MLESYIFFDGAIVPISKARIDPSDLGILRGYAVYEGITAYNGIPFHFSDHFKRLESSASAIGLSIPLSEKEAYDGAVALIAKNSPHSRAILRVILSGGPAHAGIEYLPERSLFYMLCEPISSLPKELYQEGGKLITHEHERYMPEYKTITYITAVQLQGKRKESQAIEILYTTGDEALECATSNIVIVKNGVLITPVKKILKGITRNVVLDLARGASLTVEERSISLNEVLGADEVFITSSFKDIVPIVRIDDHIIADGVPGVVTKEIISLFENNTLS
jgi:branched-chain amino acid aminotransferase